MSDNALMQGSGDCRPLVGRGATASGPRRGARRSARRTLAGASIALIAGGVAIAPPVLAGTAPVPAALADAPGVLEMAAPAQPASLSAQSGCGSSTSAEFQPAVRLSVSGGTCTTSAGAPGTPASPSKPPASRPAPKSPAADPPAANPPAPTPPTSPTTPSAPAPSGRASALAGTVVGSQSYAVPAASVKVVSPTGNDASNGSAAAPYRTVARAISQVPAGGTVVLREGTYHEALQIYKQVTIQAWPGETVWFDGSTVVSGWVSDGSIWRYDGWTIEFDTSPTFTRGAADSTQQYWGFVNANYPMAAHPDQIWVDGTAMRQVGSRAEVTAGTFFHDRPADRLYLGSDPTAREVRASALVRAIAVRADGVTLRGFGVRRFAPSVPDMGTITLEKNNALVEHVAVTDNSATGIHTHGINVTVRNVVVARNGLLGFHATNADNLVLDRLLVEGNNVENFNQAPSAGGAKINRAKVVNVRNSVFRDNGGTGLWFDQSNYDLTLIGNEMRNNRGHGAFLEISAKAVFVDNNVVGNRGQGIKVNNTSDVQIWNNTFAGNDRNVNLVQDQRRHGDGTPGQDPRYPNDPRMTWLLGPVTVHNNIIANPQSGNCLLCVEDYSGQHSAEQMGITANHNVYNRTATNSPTWVVVWSRGAGNPGVHTTLAAFTTATGQEANGTLITGNAVVTADGTRTSQLPNTNGARPLPATIANLAGKPVDARHYGAW